MVSMRVLAAFGVSLSAITGGAQASSIVVLGASTTTPSIVRLAPEPMKPGSMPSVVALGEPPPDVTDEKVAAIPEKPAHHGSMQSPMIIRGGVVGGAFATPAAAPAKATTATAPATDTKPADDGKPAETATASNGTAEAKPQPEPKQPQPAAAQPAPISPVEKAM
ncbi:hypothetical protein [Mesorhizobium sp. 131-2-1]|uniref:hypothetical protein n=1 Tax=Mesorhizobium sp. 131-2-1 TaxID=2744518 RepID=UPI001928FADB|nr:hypothetical protein [Mesorhizobium sp. 131-2-1]BCG96265.1 hypothetical protein MesoLj131a_51290 [Mesorhizobium sp. 131-2-1]